MAVDERNMEVVEEFILFNGNSEKIIKESVKDNFTCISIINLFEDRRLDIANNQKISELFYNWISDTNESLAEKKQILAIINFNTRDKILTTLRSIIKDRKNNNSQVIPIDIIMSKFADSLNALNLAMLYSDLSRIYQITDSIDPINFIKIVNAELDKENSKSNKDEIYCNSLVETIEYLREIRNKYLDKIHSLRMMKLRNGEGNILFIASELEVYSRNISNQIVESIKQTCIKMANLCDYYNQVFKDKSMLNPFGSEEILKSCIELSNWAKDKFQSPSNSQTIIRNIMGISEEIGEMTRPLLKQDQGIRGTFEEHEIAMADAMSDVCIFAANTFGQISTCSENGRDKIAGIFSCYFSDINKLYSACIETSLFDLYSDSYYITTKSRVGSKNTNNNLCETLCDMIYYKIESDFDKKVNNIIDYRRAGLAVSAFEEHFDMTKTFLACVDNMTKSISIWLGQLTAMVASRTTIAQYLISNRFRIDMIERYGDITNDSENNNCGVLAFGPTYLEDLEFMSMNLLSLNSNPSIILGNAHEAIEKFNTECGICNQNIVVMARTKYAARLRNTFIENLLDRFMSGKSWPKEDKRDNLLINLPVFEMTSSQFLGDNDSGVIISKYSSLINAFGFRYLTNPFFMTSSYENKTSGEKLRGLFNILNPLLCGFPSGYKNSNDEFIDNKIAVVKNNEGTLVCVKYFVQKFERILETFSKIDSFDFTSKTDRDSYYTLITTRLLSSIYSCGDSGHCFQESVNLNGNYSEMISTTLRSKPIKARKESDNGTKFLVDAPISNTMIYSPMKLESGSVVDNYIDSFTFLSMPLVDHVSVINNICFAFFINGYAYRNGIPAQSNLINTIMNNEFHDKSMFTVYSQYTLAQTLSGRLMSDSNQDKLMKQIEEVNPNYQDGCDVEIRNIMSSAESINSEREIAIAAASMRADLARVINVMRAMFYMRHGFDLFIDDADIENLTPEQKKFSEFAYKNVVKKILKRDWNKNPNDAHKT